MSRRKDRERARLRKMLAPNYKGYRGIEPKPPSKPELKSLTCAVCGRKRNVSPGTPEEGFVCASCQPGEEPSSS